MKPIEAKDDKKKNKAEESAKEVKPVADADSKKKKGPNKVCNCNFNENLLIKFIL